MQPLGRMARLAGGAPGGGRCAGRDPGQEPDCAPETAVSGHTRAPWTGAPYP